MTEHGTDRYGAEYKRTSNDFRFKALPYDNHVCSVCHGTGAKIEFEYVARNYESARRKGKICKTLQAHGRSVWICPVCVKNMMEKWTMFYRQVSGNEPLEKIEADKRNA